MLTISACSRDNSEVATAEPTPSREAVVYSTPNILVVIAGAVGAEHLAAYGAARGSSPYLDRLANEGILFENAFSAAPSTWQSVASILSGLYPPRHGVRMDHDAPLVAQIPTLAGLLQAKGYATAAFDAGHDLQALTNGGDFEIYVDSDSLPPSHATDEALMEQALTWLEGQAVRQPAFALVRLRGAEWPYQPKQKYHEFFAGGAADNSDHQFNKGDPGITLERGSDGRQRERLSNPVARRQFLFATDMSEEALEHMLLHYDGAVRSTDDAIGIAFERLQADGLADSTLFLVTADHGEAFGANGYLHHGPRLDDTVMRVPLVIRFPKKGNPGVSGQRVSTLVRTVDIMPTLLAVAEVGLPERLHGISLLPIIAGTSELTLTAYGESDEESPSVDNLRRIAGVAGKHRMLRDNNWKLYLLPDVSGKTYALYDVRPGGNENEDVGGANPEVIADLQQYLDPIVDADPRGALIQPTAAPATTATPAREGKKRPPTR